MQGQNGFEEKSAEVYKAYNADDRILQACIKLRSEGKKVFCTGLLYDVGGLLDCEP